MYGLEVSSLSVWVESGSNSSELFHKEGNYGDHWNYGQITLNTTTHITVSRGLTHTHTHTHTHSHTYTAHSHTHFHCLQMKNEVVCFAAHCTRSEAHTHTLHTH